MTGSDLWSRPVLSTGPADDWSQRGQSAKCTEGPAPHRPCYSHAQLGSCFSRHSAVWGAGGVPVGERTLVAHASTRVTFWILSQLCRLLSHLEGLSSLTCWMWTAMPSLWARSEDGVVFVKKPSAFPGTEWVLYRCEWEWGPLSCPPPPRTGPGPGETELRGCL